jgi:hypothetical protein
MRRLVSASRAIYPDERLLRQIDCRVVIAHNSINVARDLISISSDQFRKGIFVTSQRAFQQGVIGNWLHDNRRGSPGSEIKLLN